MAEKIPTAKQLLVKMDQQFSEINRKLDLILAKGGASPDSPSPEKPTHDKMPLFVARQQVHNFVDQYPQLKILADTPTFVWLTNSGDADRVAEITSKAKAAGAIPMFCVYNMVNRDLGSYSQGGAANFQEYENFIKKIAANTKTPSIFVIEPDTLPQHFDEGRKNAFRFEAKTLKATGSKIFLDAGHSAWHSVDETANRLSTVIQDADGFALNVSNYRSDAELIDYGNKVIEKLKEYGITGKKFIIDTSRNGAGPLGNEWCNPEGRKIGYLPEILNQGNHYGNFWIKAPGESDGDCGKGHPQSGEFWIDQALKLVS